MKKTLFWMMSPFTFCAMFAFALLQLVADAAVEGLHKFEGWCFNYKTRFPDLKYKGDGIYSNVPD